MHMHRVDMHRLSQLSTAKLNLNLILNYVADTIALAENFFLSTKYWQHILSWNSLGERKQQDAYFRCLTQEDIYKI